MARTPRRRARGTVGRLPGWAWWLGGAGAATVGYFLWRPRTAGASLAASGAPVATQDLALLPRYPDHSTADERRRIVTAMQRQLVALGFAIGPHGADGVEGDATREAERSFILRYNLTASLSHDDAGVRRLIAEIDARYRATRSGSS